MCLFYLFVVPEMFLTQKTEECGHIMMALGCALGVVDIGKFHISVCKLLPISFKRRELKLISETGLDNSCICLVQNLTLIFLAKLFQGYISVRDGFNVSLITIYNLKFI